MSQFHYGSIKTVEKALRKGDDVSSQFHYGSIKTMFEETGLIDKKVGSQFHYGSIKTLMSWQQLKKKQSKVSIPLWFD